TIMTAVPLGFIGVASSLWAFGSTLSVNSMLGLILLCGTAVNNSILFLDFFNKIRVERPDESVINHLMETAKLRFRPILITTMTTVLGMVPIAIGWGSGGEILQPLGIAVCGGLWISTILTVFVVPMVVVGTESLKKLIVRRGWLKWAGQASAALLAVSWLGLGWTNDTVAQESLSLEKAIEKTIGNHPELNVAQSQERRSEFASRSIFSELLPTVS